MPLHEIKDGHPFLSSSNELFYNPSTEESTSTDDEEGFLSRSRGSHDEDRL